jgi:hypothetical protein
MTLVQILVLLFSFAAVQLVFLFAGAGMGVWFFYSGRTGKLPIPEFRNPLRRETPQPKHEETTKAPPITRGM